MKYFISKMERISRPEYMNREDGSYAASAHGIDLEFRWCLRVVDTGVEAL